MMRNRPRRGVSSSIGAILLCAACRPAPHAAGPAAGDPASAAPAAALDVVRVVPARLDIAVRLPGELQPYEAVAVFPKVTGFVERIDVDRGSIVRSGEVVARLVAPEIEAQRAEAASKLQSAVAQEAEARAKQAADEGTFQKLRAASTTPGVVAGNDLEVAEKAAEADRARSESAGQGAAAARAALRSISEVERYLVVRAPIDGVVTERNVHPGALVGPASGPGAAAPIVRIEATSRLRLVVPVPERYVGGVEPGAKVTFTVPAYPGEVFSGTLTRVSRSVDVRTRTMPVEADVDNDAGRLAPGMFPEAMWPVRRAGTTLFVPASAVVKTTERVFVVRVRDGRAEWVDVLTGESDGDRVEVFGELSPQDEVAARGSDEVRPGDAVAARLLPPSPRPQAPSPSVTTGRSIAP